MIGISAGGSEIAVNPHEYTPVGMIRYLRGTKELHDIEIDGLPFEQTLVDAMLVMALGGVLRSLTAVGYYMRHTHRIGNRIRQADSKQEVHKWVLNTIQGYLKHGKVVVSTSTHTYQMKSISDNLSWRGAGGASGYMHSIANIQFYGSKEKQDAK